MAMTNQRKPLVACSLLLKPLQGLVVKFEDFSAVGAENVVMVLIMGNLIDRASTRSVMRFLEDSCVTE
jgi:hypothetical protein